jgi:hypothetical protein
VWAAERVFQTADSWNRARGKKRWSSVPRGRAFLGRDGAVNTITNPTSKPKNLLSLRR